MEYTLCDKKLIVGTGTVEICHGDIFEIINGNDLEEVQLPPTLRLIHDNTFFDFPHIKRINVPEGVEHIGAQAFWGLDDLKELTLPLTVRFIGKHAFCNCTQLTLTIPGNPRDIPTGWDTEFAANIKNVCFQENASRRTMEIPEDKNVTMARMIAEKVALEGGRAFYVGGIVRDHILGRDNKDVDIEVHGITPEKLAEILESFGEITKTGLSFGVFGLKKYEIDIAMPRKEKAVGRGHRDFETDVDPFIGYEKAALRRDFTMNAMMEDVLSGEILDFFGGKEDLKSHLIRHVNDVTYREDALRVLRGAQFAARFGFEIAEETREISRTVSLTDIAPERIHGELNKALMKSQKPSVFFEEMRKMGKLSRWFPEIEALIGVPQNPVHHPEGDVWAHTMLVLDAAAALRSEAAYPEGFMMAALCHDLGKAVSTQVEEHRISSIGHEISGIGLARQFLRRISNENKLRHYVLNMVELHMRPNMMASDGAGRKATTKMFDKAVCPEDLLLLAKADHFGKGNAGDYSTSEAFLRQRLSFFRELMLRPFVQGRDLLEAGLEPGADFNEALAYSHKMRLAGVPKAEALAQTLAYIRKLRQG